MRVPYRLLVDCDVWIDSYMAVYARHSESLRFVNEALEKDCELLFGASKLETVFFVIRADTKGLIRAKKGEVSERDAEFALWFAWGCVGKMRLLSCGPLRRPSCSPCCESATKTALAPATDGRNTPGTFWPFGRNTPGTFWPLSVQRVRRGGHI